MRADARGIVKIQLKVPVPGLPPTVLVSAPRMLRGVDFLEIHHQTVHS
jgi:hypothetical protein